VASEVAIIKGFTEALIVLMFAVVLAFVADNRKG
jgi:hypothetical protein